MEKLVEKLTEKYLMKIITEKTFEIYQRDFQSNFEYCCQNVLPKDSTIGATFRMIEQTCYREVWNYIEQMAFRINIFSDGKSRIESDNPFIKIADYLLDDFLDKMDLRGWIDLILNDEWNDKELELLSKNIINEHGDFIK